MVRKSNSEWRPVQLPKDLVDEVERTIKTDMIKKKELLVSVNLSLGLLMIKYKN